MKIRAIYPIWPPLRFDSDASVEIYRSFIDYFQTEKQLTVRGGTSHDGEKLFVRTRKFTRADESELKKGFPWKVNWVLEFRGTFNFPGVKKFNLKKSDGTIEPTPVKELKDMWVSLLPDDLDLTIQTYLMALILAFPGAMRPTNNIWWVGRKKHYYSKYYKSPIHEAMEYIYKIDFKPRQDIEPEDVINWVFKSNGIFDGYSDTPFSRSLNFFTRLFVEDFRNDELSDFVWAVASIEALLVEGGRSSSGQLKEKLAAIFHDRVDVTKLSKGISDLYNFRSRMIHGDRQIKSAFRVNEDEINSRFYEEYHSLLLAVGILVMLLREAIVRGVQRLEFSTIVKIPPLP
jgi:hypothetical protein